MSEVIAGRFLILEGEKPRSGGMSVVRKAVNTSTGAFAAVKYVNAATDALTRKIFEREVATLRNLSHPNIVTLIDSGIDETETLYLVLNWVDRGLPDMLSARGPLPWRDMLEGLALPLASAVSHAHLKGVEHRDIKPLNILLTDEDAPMLVDFGIGKLRHVEQTEGTVHAFRSGIYAPPELEASLPYVRDVFSLAVVLIQSMHADKLRDYHEIETALSALAVPPDLRQLLERCVHADPSCRPANGSVLHQELLRFAAEGRQAQSAQQHTALLRLTKAAREQLVGPGGDADAAGPLVLKDLQGEPCVEYRFDSDLQQHDPSMIFLAGQQWRYTLKPDESTGELVVTAARQYEFEALEQMRRRALAVTGWLTWASVGQASAPSAKSGLALLHRSLEGFYAERESGRNMQQEGAGGEGDLLDGWSRLLQAREDLARGERQPLQYEQRQQRKRQLDLTLIAPVEAELVGSEWEIRLPGGGRRIASGEVVAQAGQQLSLLLRGRSGGIPERGEITPYLGPSQVALQRQGDAVNAVRNGTGARPDLRAMLVEPSGVRTPQPVVVDSWRASLDLGKRRAVEAALGAEDLLVIKGPPGTGKTSFITELVSQLLAREPEARILLVSQTHVAVDNALERLQAAGVSGLVRLGKDDDPRISSSVQPLLLEQQMQKWAASLRNRAESAMAARAQVAGVEPRHLRAAMALQELVEILRQQERVEEHVASLDAPGSTTSSAIAVSLDLVPDTAELQQRLDFLAEQQADKRSAALVELEGDLTLRTEMSAAEAQAAVHALLGDDEAGRALLLQLRLQVEWLQRVASDNNLAAAFLATSRVIAGTCLGFMRHRAVRELTIDLCVLDEASKATSTEALVPLARATRAVLVGDTHQLPPSDEDLLRRADLLEEHQLTPELVKETLFQRLTDHLPADAQYALLDQYRMIRPIGDLISACFYEGELRSPNVQGLPGHDLLSKPVLWLDTSGLGDRRREDAEGGGGSSYANRTEAQLVMERLRSLEGALDKRVLRLPDEHTHLEVLLISPYRSQVAELKRRVATLRTPHLQVTVESVDAVQGRETDITIFSVTRSNQAGRLGFLGQSYWRRINVALSRARYGLAIVGDADFCRNSPGALKTVLEYMAAHPESCEIRAVDSA